MSTEPQYVQLPSSDDPSESEEGGHDAPVNGRRKQAGNDSLFFWTCIATLCSTALSVILFSANVLRDCGTHTDFETSTIGRPLRRPSTYVNLEKALINSNHTFPPIHNFPQMVYQISPSDSHRKMVEADRSFKAKIGTVYPDARNIYITDKISTVVQFRHIDFGMERCSLISQIPSKASASNPSSNVRQGSIIDVWALDTSTEISRHIGDSWKYAPRRVGREKLTSVPFTTNRQHDPYTFRCPSNEFSTFELACAPGQGPECHVDFWQDQRAQPVAGLYLLQQQTNGTSSGDLD